MDTVKIKAPATVANLSCGYDILGLCLQEPYDEIEISKISKKEIVLDVLDSKYSNIPSNPKENTGGIPAILIQEKLNLDYGFNIKIKKGIPLCGGLGSSAATAAGVVYGINQLIDKQLSLKEMVEYSLEGEKISSDTPHADNIAPCLVGGLVLVKETYPLDLIQIPIGAFYLAIIHPEIEVNTKMAREMLPETIKLDDAVKQWGNISALTYGFTVNDIEIIKSSMKDFIVEPVRSKLIKGFSEIQCSAIKSGAIGSSISGSGPSIFALCENKEQAQLTIDAMCDTAKQNGLEYQSYISSINHSGVEIIR